MASEAINRVKRAIKAGQKDKAKQLLKPILQNEPSADAWTLAAYLMDDAQQQKKCLHKALELDEWHSEANRMLYNLEGGNVQSASERGYEVDTGFQAEMDEIQQTAREQGNFLSNLFKGRRNS